jgi:hypothetical protein
MAQVTMKRERRKRSKASDGKLEATRRRWKRRARGPIIVPPDIPGLGWDALAVPPGLGAKVVRLLKENGIAASSMGPLDDLCARGDHQGE